MRSRDDSQPSITRSDVKYLAYLLKTLEDVCEDLGRHEHLIDERHRLFLAIDGLRSFLDPHASRHEIALPPR